MNRKHSTIQIRLYLASAVILFLGLFCAAWVYVVAEDYSSESNAVSYEIIDGHKYALENADSKRYQYDMERFGGKANVVADEFNQWLSSLWHGKRLACTIALLSIGGALVCLLIAQHPDYKLTSSLDEEKDG